uniref:MADS-box protein 23 n=1 Tax=Cunninghamia lanceolata TaxID=28977 RepID=A0A8F3BZD5_CUNLA|nr:MADS-box protein 23 [Cunninghamia lanceolata]
MGRNKIAIEEIKNESKRQVTFSKRQKGLFKKAQELAVLTSSQVAVITFSSSGKLFQYSSESMTNLLKRCYKYQFSGQRIDNLQEEIVLKNENEQLQLRIKRMMGEELSNLDMKELQELEQVVEAGMSRIKARKNESLLEKIGEIEKKDSHLEEENRILRAQLLEAAKTTRDSGVPESG